jgi:tetratricopeptide (TPR) repeat protein
MDMVKDQKVSPGDKSKSTLFYILLFLIAFLPRLLYLLSIVKNPFFHFPIIDGQTYDDWAQEIAKGHFLGDKVFWQAPLYPYFLGIIYWIFGHSLFLVRFIQILLGTVNCLLLYRIARTAFNSKVALLTFLIATFYGPFLFFDAEILNPVLIILLNLVLILVLFSFSRIPKKSKLFWAGIILGLSSITHGLIIVFLPFILLWIISVLRKTNFPTGRILKYTLSLLVGFFLILAITAVRNRIVGKDMVWISSNSGINFYIGNNPDYDQTTSIRPGIEWEELIQRPIQHGFTQPSEKSNYFWKESFSYIAGQPFSYLQLLAKKFILILDGFEIKRNQDMYLYRNYSFILSILLWKWVIYFPLGIILPLSLVGMVIFWKDRSDVKAKNGKPLLIFYIVISQVLGLLFFFICDRYRIPLIPFLIVFAGFALYRIFEMIKLKQTKKYLMLILMFLFLVVISNIRRHPTTTQDQAEDHYNLASVLAKEQKFDQAVSEYSRALSLEPGHIMARYSLGVLYQRENKIPEAEKEYQQVIARFPQAALAYNNLGSIYEKKGDLTKAKEMYAQSSQLHPLLADPLFNLGNMYAKEGKYPQAVALFDSCLKADPQYYKAYNGLGDYYYRNSEIDRAIYFFQKALAIEPGYEIAHNNLGTAYISKGLREKAFSEFQEAAKINPNYGQAHLNLGNYYLEAQEVSSAIEQYKLAVGQLPYDPKAHYHLAVAYVVAGFENDAIAQLDTALSYDTTFVQAKDLLERLKKK